MGKLRDALLCLDCEEIVFLESRRGTYSSLDLPGEVRHHASEAVCNCSSHSLFPLTKWLDKREETKAPEEDLVLERLPEKVFTLK